jgi:hypothetical protein
MPVSDDRGASEVAQALAALAPALPEKTLQDVRRLLAQSIAAPGAGARREARLGLLLRLVATGSAEVPTVETYQRARNDAEARGENWPTHSTLIRAYGHWLAAVRAAMRLHFEGASARVAASHRHAFRHRNYTRDEILTALDRCRAALEDWPTQWEYEEWAFLVRQRAQTAGLADPRLPVLKPIRRYFGTFAAAIEAAQQRGR